MKPTPGPKQTYQPFALANPHPDPALAGASITGRARWTTVDRDAACRALALVEGVARDDRDADGLVVDAFDTVEDAVRAHAHLAGFILEALAHHHRHEPVAVTAEYVRRLLGDR